MKKCPRCKGKKRRGVMPCAYCNGTGVVREEDYESMVRRIICTRDPLSIYKEATC
jgi:DnaJ-class molecular chaperone